MALETIILGRVNGKLDLSLRGLAGLVDAMFRSENVVELPVTNRFTPGLYIRELFVPAGTAIVTRVHTTTHPYTVSQGKVLIWTEKDGVKLIQAPFTGVTEPGTCRLAVVLEDLVWTTYHANPDNITDVPILEKMLGLDPREAAQLEEKELKCLLQS